MELVKIVEKYFYLILENGNIKMWKEYEDGSMSEHEYTEAKFLRIKDQLERSGNDLIEKTEDWEDCEES